MEASVLIVVVEDDLVIRDCLSIALKKAGYAVEVASGGEEAIAVLERCKSECRALITDIILGDRGSATGWDVARHARELNRSLAVVYMSGDSGAAWASRGVPKSIFIAKPFDLAQIETAVSQLLSETG
ncbi:MAG: response regulator [Rhodospirillales bacterium]|nr:response regulator [Rhodospirillales bacterium]